MKIAHIAVWTNKLEEMKDFYVTYFNGISSDKYTNEKKGFESYFVQFNGETTLEIMRKTSIDTRIEGEHHGFCHIAFQLENREKVLEMTETFRNNGFKITGEPRVTGDGFFESVVLDVDNNIVELVAE